MENSCEKPHSRQDLNPGLREWQTSVSKFSFDLLFVSDQNLTTKSHSRDLKWATGSSFINQVVEHMPPDPEVASLNLAVCWAFLYLCMLSVMGP